MEFDDYYSELSLQSRKTSMKVKYNTPGMKKAMEAVVQELVDQTMANKKALKEIEAAVQDQALWRGKDLSKEAKVSKKDQEYAVEEFVDSTYLELDYSVAMAFEKKLFDTLYGKKE